MTDRLRVTRTVTPDECDWLEASIDCGRVVYRYHGITYGCISDGGIAVTYEPDKTPFFELPIDALKELLE